MAPGSPPDDPVGVLAPCFIPPRLLQSGGSFCHILSAASDAPVRGTGFTPGRSSPGASAVLHSAPVAPIRGVFLSLSPCCLGRSSPWRRVHPRTIQSGGLCCASLRPVCSNPGRLFVVFSPLPRTLQSVAPGSPPDDPDAKPPWDAHDGVVGSVPHVYSDQLLLIGLQSIARDASDQMVEVATVAASATTAQSSHLLEPNPCLLLHLFAQSRETLKCSVCGLCTRTTSCASAWMTLMSNTIPSAWMVLMYGTRQSRLVRTRSLQPLAPTT